MNFPLPSLPIRAIIPIVLAVGTLPSFAQNAAENANTEIEQLAVGNYWTSKETTYDKDGEIDTEEFSTVAVIEKEKLAGRTCFRMKQTYHDDARFNPKQAQEDGDAGYVYWEYLENGNLYYFDSKEEDAEKAGEKSKETPGAEAPAADLPSRFTEDNPALYLKHPATAGDLYQSFDTVGRVIATDRVVQTPAGEFICHVYGFLTDASEALPHRSYTLEYWCPGIGFVKLEEYEISGEESRLSYSMELLAYHLEDGRSGGTADDNGRRNKIENVH